MWDPITPHTGSVVWVGLYMNVIARNSVVVGFLFEKTSFVWFVYAWTDVWMYIEMSDFMWFVHFFQEKWENICIPWWISTACFLWCQIYCWSLIFHIWEWLCRSTGTKRLEKSWTWFLFGLTREQSWRSMCQLFSMEKRLVLASRKVGNFIFNSLFFIILGFIMMKAS